jgi:hypothetical protein
MSGPNAPPPINFLRLGRIPSSAHLWIKTKGAPSNPMTTTLLISVQDLLYPSQWTFLPIVIVWSEKPLEDFFEGWWQAVVHGPDSGLGTRTLLQRQNNPQSSQHVDSLHRSSHKVSPFSRSSLPAPFKGKSSFSANISCLFQAP